MRIFKDIILKAYFLIRLPFLCLLRAIVRPRKKSGEEASRILIIRLDRMGDFILSLPVIENIRLAYPNAKIDILVRPYLKGLATLIKAVDNVIVHEGMPSTLARLGHWHYDIAIDMLYDYKIKPALIALLSRAPVRIGFGWGFRQALFTGSIPPRKNAHMVELNLELLRLLHVPDKVRLPNIGIERGSAIADKAIAIHPGGYYRSQRWSPSKFAELARRISHSCDVKVMIIGGPGETKIVKDIMDSIGDARVYAVYPDIKELISILGGSSLLVCNNSGPLHLAAAMGVSTVSIMGPTDPALWWPSGANQTVVSAQGGPIDLISVDEVFSKVKDELERLDADKR